jgi:hypothetical protein
MMIWIVSDVISTLSVWSTEEGAQKEVERLIDNGFDAKYESFMLDEAYG